MPPPDWKWKLERRFPSDAAPGHEAIGLLLAELEGAGWPTKDVYGVHLALEEALVNAIRHGNGNDRTAKAAAKSELGRALSRSVPVHSAPGQIDLSTTP